MTETLSLFGTAEATADMILKRIRDELGFTVNIGISTNKLLAKMAGDLKKPDYTHTLYPEEIKEKMWPLPIEELFFCGRASAKKLRNMGIQTIRDLAGTSPELLQANLKSQGRLLWNFANGFDFSAVESKPAPQKGIGLSLIHILFWQLLHFSWEPFMIIVKSSSQENNVLPTASGRWDCASRER